MRALVVDPALVVPGQRHGVRRKAAPLALPVPVQMREVRTPVPQGPGWVLVRPSLAGICPTDLSLVHGDATPSILTAYDEPRAIIPGHEIVGVIERAGPTRWAREGHRVLVEPTLRCAHKGLPACRRCRAGETHLCENADRAGALCSGSAIGSSQRTGGGWSEGFLVHEDMLVPADGISDQRGVLAEPAASALHAVQRWSRSGDRAFVMGSGALSRLIVATLRRLHQDLDVTVLYDARSLARPRLGRRARQPEHLAPNVAIDYGAIRAVGAARVWRGASDHLLQRSAELIGARLLRTTTAGLPVLDGGVDVVFDCLGTAASTELSLRLLRAGGTLVLCGRSGRHEIEWPLVWARELTVCGSALYGREPSGRRTFGVVREWLTDASFPVDGLVTHRFPLDEFDSALNTATAGAAAGAIKVVFQGSVASIRARLEKDAEHDDIDEPLPGSTAARIRVRGAAGQG